MKIAPAAAVPQIVLTAVKVTSPLVKIVRTAAVQPTAQTAVKATSPLAKIVPAAAVQRIAHFGVIPLIVPINATVTELPVKIVPAAAVQRIVLTAVKVTSPLAKIVPAAAVQQKGLTEENPRNLRMENVLKEKILPMVPCASAHQDPQPRRVKA